MPHACIGVDVIVGFPGETHEDFLDSYNFINELDVNYLHVFTYSERANTPAAELPNPVDMNTRRERNERLRILSEKKLRQFYESHLNTTRTVLIEKGHDNTYLSGYTDNYIKVKFDFDECLINATLPIYLDEIQDNVVLGKIMTLSES